jgi:hypothetical protein
MADRHDSERLRGFEDNISTPFLPYPRVRAALLKIKSTTYKLFFAIFLTTVLL